jgi:tetratricopeptide (TPR) repeat protein
MRQLFLAILSWAFLNAPFTAQASPADDALAVYKSGNYQTALPQLQIAVTQNPKDPNLQAALLSALVYEGHTDEAADAAEAAGRDFPLSPEIMTARADFLYYMGDVREAEVLYKASLKVKEENARAYYGLYRLFYAASMYRSARIMCMRAHAVDPDDALITFAFMHYLVEDKRKELYRPFMAAHPWFARHYEQVKQTSAEVHEELDGRKAFELQGERTETTLHLVDLLAGAARIRGFGLEVSIEGGRPLRLLLDTGASGIVISQRAVDKAGLNHLGSTESWGVGDGGVRKGFVAVAESCRIGSLQYKTCVFQSLEGKGRIAGDEDGLIGTDFFADYLIQLDFQRHAMRLTPLPPRPLNLQGYDRTTTPDKADFTPIFRFGHSLCIPTKVNGKTSGLFLLDTGAGISNIDSTFARLSTKLHGDEYTRIRGVSGNVKEVFEADKAELEFGHFRQRNLGLAAFNINNGPNHQEVRLAGILGLPVLVMFRLTLDYRDGLVKFDYVLK